MEQFTIEIADVPIEIRCRFSENKEFLKEYLSAKEPLAAISPTDADLAKLQADFDRMDELDGVRQHRRTDRFLENNAIHALLAEKLVEHNVLLMHGSALCMDGQAYIFTAKSGTGKSTHARLWREAFGERVWMINDDKPMLRIEETGVTVYGTPWNGKHHLSRNASAPLKAIVRLTRAAKNRIEPLDRADGFGMLMKQCLTSPEPAVMKQILELEKRLLNAAELYDLECNMSPEVAQVAFAGMQ